MKTLDERIDTANLERCPSPSAWWAVWAAVAAFGTYFCMYGFRKPFTAASYADHDLSLMSVTLSFKSLAVIAQVFGYMVSKFVGIKVVSEMPSGRRAVGILALIGIAELALLFFALLPFPYNALALFFNGIPLGMVFGLVIGFLEGRRLTEALSAGLCTSFIVADGFTKSVGSYLLRQNVSEQWMPFTSGLIFLPALGLFVWMLTRIPPPTSADLAERSERVPVDAGERRSFFRRYANVLLPLIVIYLLVTIIRSLRADFQPELWRGLGQETKPEVFSQTELLVAFGVLIANACTFLIRDNRKAFRISLGISIAGLALVGVALASLSAGRLSGFSFMVMTGLGLYLPYVAFHTTIFERLIAVTRDRANMGYLMYLADAIGYLGYVGVLLSREFLAASADSVLGSRASILSFFVATCWTTVIISTILFVVCWHFFARHKIESSKLSTAV